MKNKNLIAIIGAVILFIIAMACIYFSYKENIDSKNEKEAKDEKDTNAIVIYIENIVENDDTYTLKGVSGEKYIVTEEEYDYFRNHEPLIVDGEKYYYEWSDDKNEYIFTSKNDNNVFYLEKGKDSKYQVKNYDNKEEVYRRSDTKIQLTVNKSIKCIDQKDNNIKLKAYLKKNNAKKIKVHFDGKKVDYITVY